MNFSAWAIRKPTPSILLFIMLTVAGLIGFRQLGIQSFPDVDLPAITVVATLPGATPPQLETEVTRPIEDAVASLGAVEHVRSTINDGVSVTVVQFELEKDVQEALIDVRDAVTRIRATLPNELQEPTVSRVNIAGGALLTYAVSAANMDEADLSWFVDNTVSKTLLPVKGVGQVKRQGGVTREALIELDPVRLQALNVSAGEISTQLRAMQQESPGGRADLGGLEQAVRTIATVPVADELGDVAVPLADGRRLRLGDVATVRDGIAERRQIALLDGKPVISFQVMRARGFDEVSVADNVRAAIEGLRQQHPRVGIKEVSDSVRHIRSSYDASMHALYEGAVLAVLVVWLFLRDWRATVVSAVALPLSVIPTFLVMWVLGYTLNGVTLLALTLVVGILVDDAIVEVENIVRHLGRGKTPRQAAMEAAQEIGLAVIATSLTLVAVFLPTAFIGGITGTFFKQFGWTASVAVLFSLLVARLLTPMMAAYFLKARDGVKPDGPLMRRYLRAVRWCLSHPRHTSLGAAAFFGASLLLVQALPATFMIAEDMSSISVTVEGPPGSALEHTSALAEQTRRILAQMPEVRSVYTTVGAGVTGSAGPGSSKSAAEVNTAQLVAQLSPIAQRERTQQGIEADLRPRLRAIPGARISLGVGSPGEGMSLMLAGDDPVALQKAAQAVAADLRGLPGLGAVSSSASLLRPEIVIRPDFERAAELGITAGAIGQAVRIATTGDYDFNLPRLNLPERQLYVRVQLDPKSRGDLDTIAQLRVKGARGAVPLENIADIRVEGGPPQIDRYDRHRNVTISVELQGRPLGDVLDEANRLPSLRQLPAGVERVNSGDVEHLAELFGGFLLAMLAGIFCVYAVMVLLFEDFGQPVTVLAALPLAAGGALGMLVVFGFSLSLASLIGLLMLIGIVTKNSILLVEYAIMAQRDFGMTRTEALVDACHKRARPIVMTTVAMAAGMLPMALGLEGGSSFRAPMAATVIGGLITSTVLSLLVVPVVFELVDDAKARVRRGFGPGVARAGLEPDTPAGQQIA